MMMVEKLGRELISPSADRFWRMKSLDKVVTDRFKRLNDTITRLFRDVRRWKTSTRLLEIPKLDRTSLARDKYARSPRSVSADRFLPNRRKRTIVVDIMYLHTSKTLKRVSDIWTNLRVRNQLSKGRRNSSGWFSTELVVTRR